MRRWHCFEWPPIRLTIWSPLILIPQKWSIVRLATVVCIIRSMIFTAICYWVKWETICLKPLPHWRFWWYWRVGICGGKNANQSKRCWYRIRVYRPCKNARCFAWFMRHWAAGSLFYCCFFVFQAWHGRVSGVSAWYRHGASFLPVNGAWHRCRYRLTIANMLAWMRLHQRLMSMAQSLLKHPPMVACSMLVVPKKYLGC